MASGTRRQPQIFLATGAALADDAGMRTTTRSNQQRTEIPLAFLPSMKTNTPKSCAVTMFNMMDKPGSVFSFASWPPSRPARCFSVGAVALTSAP